jgi:Ferredoxin-like domain in Api92-like protein
MPNWVYNGLTAQGPKESVQKMKEQLNQPFTRVHDNWNMETQQYEKKLITYPNPVFAFWNIIKPTDLEAYDNQPDWSNGINNDGNDWYTWNLRNWGTKWDVAVSADDEHPDTYMEETEDEWTSSVFYNFNTAWGVADKALTNLSSQYPDILFTLSYEEETGWGGECEYLRGETISNEQYDNRCRDCDTMDTLLYCEDCENDVCSECGFGAEETCETHKEFANA